MPEHENIGGGDWGPETIIIPSGHGIVGPITEIGSEPQPEPHIERDAIEPTVEFIERVEPDAVQVIERAADDTGDGREILIRLLSWDEVATDTLEGIHESFARGAFAGNDPSKVTIESQRHRGDLVGRGIDIEDREDGPYLRARVSRTHAGDDLLTLINDGVLKAASIFARPISQRRLRTGVIQRTAVELARVAILDRGAYPSAAVVAIREKAPEVQEAVVTDEATIPEPTAEAPAPITPEPVTAPEAPQEEPVPPSPAPDYLERSALDPVTTKVESMDSRLATLDQRLAMLAAAPARPSAPEEFADLMGLGSFSDYLERAKEEKIIAPGGHPQDGGLRWQFATWLERTVADQIFSQNAGVDAPAWLMSVKRIVELGRPAIQALGGPQPLPAAGMTLTWPVVTSSNVIIGVQATQKTEVTSARVDIGSDTQAIGTYAGVSDISVQLLRRSAPSYSEAYDRIMLAYWAKVTDAAFAAALLSDSTAATYGWDADTTGENLKAAIFGASVQVETATGLPASAVLAATDVYAQLGRLSQIVPAVPATNPSNASGFLNAGTLYVNVAGIPVVHARGLTTGNVIVTNQQAAQWFEDGPFKMTADDATLLGTDVAWFSFGAAAVYVPAGVVRLFGPGASGS